MAIKSITPKEAYEMVTTGTLFVDVREKCETDLLMYDVKNITYLPLSILEIVFTEKLPADKNVAIILACKAGGRSMRAAEFLEKNGYNNLYNLSGGITEWMASTLPCNYCE